MSALKIADSALRRFVLRFDASREINALQVRRDFLKAFPLSSIARMTRESYVIGREKPGFCTYVEVRTKRWANITGSPANRFGVYFGRTRKDPTRAYRHAGKFGSTAREAFLNVRRHLLELLEAGRLLDFEAIDGNPLSQMFKAKILSLYFPEKYMNICSDEHLEFMSRKLAVPAEDSCSARQHALLRARLGDPRVRRWSNPKFMMFLYDTFYPGHLKSEGGMPTEPSRIQLLANALNEGSTRFEIGRLQSLRAELKGIAVASRPIFGIQSIKPRFAFHLGGRTELQFNIAEDALDDRPRVRHGVGFSLETNPTLPTIAPMLPKLKRFDDYVSRHPGDFNRFRMWCWHAAKEFRSPDLPVGPIPQEWRANGRFIAIGRHGRPGEIAPEEILRDFDRLIPLYVYVESRAAGSAGRSPRSASPRKGAGDHEGSSPPDFATSARYVLSAKEGLRDLRHKHLQNIFHRCLQKEGGRVYSECQVELGGKVDARVVKSTECIFYELKTAPTVQACVRQAFGQLMEYAYWPSATRATRLVVVGEADVTVDAQSFLNSLRKRFALPLYYRQIDERKRRLSREF